MSTANLRSLILEKHSKEQTNRILLLVNENQKKFDELVNLFLNDPDRKVRQRAGWPMSYCVEQSPGLMRPHFKAIIKNLRKNDLHDAEKRSTVRLLQFTEIPESLQGEIMDQCFRFISNPEESAAVKAFSLTILQKLTKSYPEIFPELRLIIEDRWDYETPAFKARAKSILKNSTN